MNNIITSLPDGISVDIKTHFVHGYDHIKWILSRAIPELADDNPVRDVVFEISMDTESAFELFDLGYDPTSIILLDGYILNDLDNSEIELIRSRFESFMNGVNDLLDQTREEFVQNPKFYGLQNFILENQFAIETIREMIDVRNAVIYRKNKLQRANNILLLSKSSHQHKINNISLLTSYWDNIYKYIDSNSENRIRSFVNALYQDMNSGATIEEGLKLYNEYFFESSPVRKKINVLGSNTYKNQNDSDIPTDLKLRMFINRPDILQNVDPTDPESDNGIIIAIKRIGEVRSNETIFMSLGDPIEQTRLSQNKIDPMTDRKMNISASKKFDAKSSTFNVGYGVGGRQEIQSRMPIINHVDDMKDDISNNVRVSNRPALHNIYIKRSRNG
jgi:hypothetical protein